MNKNLLKEKINQANSIDELELIVESIPKQSNGERQQIYRLLNDSFWYININTLEEHKKFMLKRLEY